ncbi:hypothetical protein DW086_13120 [Harryflintia acetispora]|nr:hypothetical protein DW086_13120 [Harryflintia acetispora]
MRTVRLNEHDYGVVATLQEHLLEEQAASMRQTKLPLELAYLQSRLAARLQSDPSEMTRYMGLLEQEQQLYDPGRAFRYGRLCAWSQLPQKEGFLHYLRYEHLRPQAIYLYEQLQESYERLRHGLGWESGELREFTEMYRELNGTVHREIEAFYKLGYQAGRPATRPAKE